MIWIVPLVAGLIAWLSAYITNEAALGPAQRAADAHWTERARLLWPARVAAATSPYMIAMAFLLLATPFLPVSYTGVVILVVIVHVASALGSFPIQQLITPAIHWRTWIGATIERTLWSLLPYLLIVIGIMVMPNEPGAEMLIVVSGYLVLHVLLILGLHLRIQRWSGALKPAPAELQALVATAAKELDQPTPVTYVTNEFTAQARALPVQQQLQFSSRLMEVCTSEEVIAIARHELAHLAEPRSVVAVRIAATFIPSLGIFNVPLTHALGRGSWYFLLMLIYVLYALHRKFNRRMEVLADERASARGTDDGNYARALARIYEANLIPATIKSRSKTHPDLYDRMVASGVSPDFPRPEPASGIAWQAVVMWAILFVLAFVLLLIDVRPVHVI